MTKQMVTERVAGLEGWINCLEGSNVGTVINYLKELPTEAVFRFKWVGYEDVESYAEIEREETDKEYEFRLKKETLMRQQEGERKKAAKRIKELEKEIAKLKAGSLQNGQS